jgi:catechol 2,3-dioxygenase-like lactoylglutathione lyase family enzyme
MRIRLAAVNLEVTDPQRSKRFYVDGIGMRENLQRSHAPGFVYLESDGVSVTLATREDGTPPAPPSPNMELGFEVDDLDAVRARFAERGITGFVPQSMGWGEVIEGHDADGHRVIIYQFPAVET